MFKYFHIIRFLVTHDLTDLKKFWLAEYIRRDKFKWRRLISRLVKNKRNANFLFLWRLANEMFLYGDKKQKRIAKKMNDKLSRKHNVLIGLGAQIGLKFEIVHYIGIVISDTTIIGDNVSIRQNTTIGRKSDPSEGNYRTANHFIKIGNNVCIGANSCIIGNSLTIGDNVNIGAMSFINKDIPRNCTVITEKTNKIILK